MRVSGPVIGLVLGFGLLGGLAACADVNTTATGRPAAGTRSTAPGATSQMPQSANSLPPGDTVNAPVSGGAGVIAPRAR